jgi:hypothetical protein
LNGTYDGTKLVRNNAGVHSWVILRSPALNGIQWYLTFDFNGAVDYQWNIWMSKAAPTGGSTSARPTATDEWQPYGGVMTVSHTSAVPMRLSMGMTSRGDFWSAYQRLGSTAVERFMIVHAPTNTNPTDLYPIYNYCYYASNTLGNIGAANCSVRNPDGGVINTNFIPTGASGNVPIDTLTNAVYFLPAQVIVSGAYNMDVYRGRLQDYYSGPGGSSFYGWNLILPTGDIGWALNGALVHPANAPMPVL